MASGSWEFGTSNSDVKGRITWSEGSKNISGNTSVVTATVQYYRDDSYLSFGTASGTLTVNGSGKSLSKYVELTSGNGWQTIGSQSVTVGHNADGTKSVTISWSGGFTNSVGTQSTSKTVTLDVIPRASSISVSSSTFMVENPLTVTITPASSSFNHKIKFWWGYSSQGNYHEEWKNVAAGTKTVTWTCPASWADYLANTDTGLLGISCDTYNGSTKVGSSMITHNLTLPKTSKWMPTAGTLTLTGVDTFNGLVLQNHSKVKATHTGGKAGDYASISKVVYTGSGMNASASNGTAVTSGTIQDSGTQTYTATLTDSRGRTAKVTGTISVTAYNPPKVSLRASRCDSSGSTTAVEKEYINATVSGSYTKLSGNSLTVTVTYKESSATSDTSLYSGTYSGDASYSITTKPGAANNYKSYIVTATVQDKVSNAVTVSVTLGVATPTVSYLAGGKGVTFFGTATKEGLWNNKSYNGIRFYGDTKVVNPNGNDTVAIMTNADNNTKLGTTDSGPSNTAVFVSNGDGDANGVHIEGAKYSKGTWYAMLSSKISGLIRLNYFVVYWEVGSYA